MAARLGSPGISGRPVAGEPSCAGGGSPDQLESIEDLEGSAHDDVFYGDEHSNQLLGHRGADSYYAAERRRHDPCQLRRHRRCDRLRRRQRHGFRRHSDACVRGPGPGRLRERLRSPAERASNHPGRRSVRRLPAPRRPHRRRNPRGWIESRRGPSCFAGRPGWPTPGADGVASPSPSARTSPDRPSAASSTANRSSPAARPAATACVSAAHAFRVFAIDRAGNRDRSPARFSFRIRRR